MGKNVAVFFDGTCNRLRVNGGTNVHALYEMARTAGGTQKCLYLSGVGTERIRTAAIDALRDRAMLGENDDRINTGALGRLFGALAGYGIGGRIRQAYAFLVDHYDEEAKDKLFLFGFSRGAFAARSLAGFIGEVGLLFRHHLSKVPAAYELYRSGAGRQFLEENYSRMLGRRVALGDGLRVYMIGVWDTVGALGLPFPFQKIAWHTDHHLTHKMPQNVTHGRHALALHELRSIFAPVPWMRSSEKQSLEQVWFAGAHADVGGGYEGSTLSTIPLLWMAFEAEKLGLTLSHDVLHVKDTTTAIHHQIRGVFSISTPQPRQLLVSLSTPFDDDASASHSVHWSAIRRLERLAVLSKPYPYRRAIRTTLADIDAITRTVAVRLTEYADRDSGADRADLYGDQKAQLVRSLALSDDWTTQRIGALRDAIVLVSLAHGWEELHMCLADTIDRLASAAYATDASAKNPVHVQRLNDTLKALELVGKTLSGPALQTFIERVTLYAYMNYTVPAKTIKVGKLKI
jgi:uncharacterized protein (DUF2235 family)